MDSATQFIPQELADIIAVRQRCERTWRARLMIYSSVISSIDSALAEFKDNVSKNEAAVFKTCSSQAISKFAAYDISSTSPPILIHNRPKKCGGLTYLKLPNRPVVVTTSAITLTPASS